MANFGAELPAWFVAVFTFSKLAVDDELLGDSVGIFIFGWTIGIVSVTQKVPGPRATIQSASRKIHLLYCFFCRELNYFLDGVAHHLQNANSDWAGLHRSILLR